MDGTHEYHVDVTWTGNRGDGTSGYRAYDRAVTVAVAGKASIEVSADTPFRGDGEKWNPEDLLLASLGECHLLSYLHACVTRDVVVTAYRGDVRGTLSVTGNAGRFERATIRPVVEVATAEMLRDAEAAHADAHAWCFIANSLAFPVAIDPTVTVARAAARA